MTKKTLSKAIPHSDLIIKRGNKTEIKTDTPELSFMRKRMDAVDKAIINLFSRRNELAQEIGSHKKKHDIIVIQKGREKEVIAERKAYAKTKKVNPGMVEEIFSILIKESVAAQKKVKGEK